MTRAAVKAERRERARAAFAARVEAVESFFILLDLWDDTAERTLFSAASYIYEKLLDPETMPLTLGEFLYETEGRYSEPFSNRRSDRATGNPLR